MAEIRFTEHFNLGDNISPEGVSPVVIKKITRNSIYAKSVPAPKAESVEVDQVVEETVEEEEEGTETTQEE